MTDRDQALIIYAALKSLAGALQTANRAVLSIASSYEKRYSIGGHAREVAPAENETYTPVIQEKG